MNTKTKLIRITNSGSALLVIVVLAGCASSGKPAVRATEEKQYIRLRHVQDTSQSFTLKRGNAAAMACAKCKVVLYRPLMASATSFHTSLGRSGPGLSGSIWSWRFERAAYQDWSTRHYCPGCKSVITATGTWFNQTETVKHTCASGGDASAVCCAKLKARSVLRE